LREYRKRTVFRIDTQFDALFGTSCGIPWLVAPIVSIATFYWGYRVIGAALDRLQAFDLSRVALPDGSRNPEFTGLIADMRRKSGIELLPLLIILTCMILMSFGLKPDATVGRGSG
jgi:hypothetical protein